MYGLGTDVRVCSSMRKYHSDFGSYSLLLDSWFGQYCCNGDMFYVLGSFPVVLM